MKIPVMHLIAICIEFKHMVMDRRDRAKIIIIISTFFLTYYFLYFFTAIAVLRDCDACGSHFVRID